MNVATGFAEDLGSLPLGFSVANRIAISPDGARAAFDAEVGGAGTTIGGTQPGEGNHIEGLRIEATATGTVVVGNNRVAPIAVLGPRTRSGGTPQPYAISAR